MSIRRQSPLKVIEIKSRIDNTKAVMYTAKFDREKCTSCNGLGIQGAGGNKIGVWNCIDCGGTGKRTVLDWGIINQLLDLQT